MVHDNNIRKRAEQLRKQGENLNTIALSINVSKSTLSGWFKNSTWSQKITEENREKASEKSAEHMKKMNTARKIILENSYEKTRKEAVQEFEKHKNEPLFVAGLMLYLGEGDKNMRSNLVRLSNIDSSVLKITQFFLQKYCYIKKDRIRFWVLLYPDLDQTTCENFWIKELDLSRKNLYKTQVIQGRHKTKRLIYGVGNIILGDKHLKVKILTWIELLSQDLSKNNTAGMV